MYCITCGARLKEGHPFCPNCGTPTKRAIAPAPASSPRCAGGLGADEELTALQEAAGPGRLLLHVRKSIGGGRLLGSVSSVEWLILDNGGFSVTEERDEDPRDGNPHTEDPAGRVKGPLQTHRRGNMAPEDFALLQELLDDDWGSPDPGPAFDADSWTFEAYDTEGSLIKSGGFCGAPGSDQGRLGRLSALLPPAEEPAGRFCLNCGAPVKEGSQICPNCGRPPYDGPQGGTDVCLNLPNLCPRCGEPLQDGARTCPRCGWPEPSDVRSPAHVGWCPLCGAEITERNLAIRAWVGDKPQEQYEVYWYYCPSCQEPRIGRSELLHEPPAGFCPSCGAIVTGKDCYFMDGIGEVRGVKQRVGWTGHKCPTCGRLIADTDLLSAAPKPPAKGYCIHCGAELMRAEDMFCVQCGGRQQPLEEPDSKEEPTRTLFQRFKDACGRVFNR